MKMRGYIVPLLSGLGMLAARVVFGQTEGTISTNSPTVRSRALPPLPPVALFPTNAQRRIIVPAAQKPISQPVPPGDATGIPGIPPSTIVQGRPVARPPIFHPPVANPAAQPLPLIADADLKTYAAKPGDTNAQFTFTLTNPSSNEVTINEVRTSCGCTVARLPAQPWVLAPGTNGDIHVTVDLRGKRGQITKLVYVNGAGGSKTLTVMVDIPEPLIGAMGDRDRNRMVASADRQAVFKNDCAKCHAEPASGKKGEALYAAACAICHDSDHRASMVPDLRALNHPIDGGQWRNWITHGKVGTLMPAFSGAEGGPLGEEQIDSLVEYLVGHISPSAVSGASSARLPGAQ